ncbi:MAG: hypothetical protein ACP5JY_01410 [Candidatus Nanoarchaeia archaeon]
MPFPAKVDAVLNIVKQGPALPIEIATKLSIDSFTAKAILDFLVENKIARATEQKVGGAPIYFIPGHELAAEAKLRDILNIKPKVGNFATEPIAQSPDLEEKRALFLERLKEIEEREKKSKENILKVPEVVPKVQEVASTQSKEIQKIEIEPLEQNLEKTIPKLDQSVQEVKESIEKSIDLKQKTLSTSNKTIERALTWLETINAKIVEKEFRKKGKEAVLKVTMPSAIGELQYLVFILTKKSVTEADLSLAHTESVRKACPVLILSNGKLTKSANAYLKELEGLVKFKSLE